MGPKTDLSEYDRKKKSIAPLVFETPCEHMKDFGPCLAEVTVYKWKLATKMATALGFPTETHKLMLVTPVDFEGKKLDFEPMVLELNFGSKKLFSSGTYMRCLKCADFSDKAMLKCSEPFICCIEKDYIINAMKSYVETIQFFGPRKCNCQSFCYYILSCFGVPEKEILDNKVVETDSGYIRGKVKELAAHMEYDRPTCKGDIYTKKTGGSRHAVAPLEIPSILGQFEMDEFKDETLCGRKQEYDRYKRVTQTHRSVKNEKSDDRTSLWNFIITSLSSMDCSPLDCIERVRSSEIMEQEVLFWTRYNFAVSKFCFEQTIATFEPEKVICSLVGEELEWCGSQAFLFLANRVIEEQRNLRDLESRCNVAEAQLESESVTANSLRKMLKQNQRDYEDSEWSLQEQLAHLNNSFQNEKDANLELSNRLSICQNKLIEVETFLSSNKGKVALQLEEQLAESKLKIAQLESEKDELMIKHNREMKLSSNCSVSSNRSVVLSNKENAEVSRKLSSNLNTSVSSIGSSRSTFQETALVGSQRNGY